jgi:hypothetical protein
MSVKYLSVKCAADLIGVTQQAVYKAIDQSTIYADKEIVNRKIEVRIHANLFLDFIQSEKQTLIKKIEKLEQAEATLRRKL